MITQSNTSLKPLLARNGVLALPPKVRGYGCRGVTWDACQMVDHDEGREMRMRGAEVCHISGHRVTSSTVFCESGLSQAGSHAVQYINQLPQPAVILAVEVEGDARQVHLVVIGHFLRRHFDALDRRAGIDVPEVLVHGREG